jgi:hypothetical protein
MTPPGIGAAVGGRGNGAAAAGGAGNADGAGGEGRAAAAGGAGNADGAGGEGRAAGAGGARNLSQTSRPEGSIEQPLGGGDADKALAPPTALNEIASNPKRLKCCQRLLTDQSPSGPPPSI